MSQPVSSTWLETGMKPNNGGVVVVVVLVQQNETKTEQRNINQEYR
jgi:hypothetical protein